MDNNDIRKERIALDRIGARAHHNSGRGSKKADGSSDRFIIDVKHAKRSFTINEQVWAKICTDAMSADNTKDPMLYLVINDRIRLAVIEYEVLEGLYAGTD